MIDFPNCKINLGLRVLRRREDGYHDLESIFLPVPLCDELEINKSNSFGFELQGITLDGDPVDNLVVKAYRLLQSECGGEITPVNIRLKKNIPYGAGLGGGSSDAAFTLKMLDRLFSLQLSDDQMRNYAARLGADCAFFVDNQPALAMGIGDNLTPLGFNPLSGHALFLVKPEESVSTAEAYRGVSLTKYCGCDDLVQLSTLVREPITEWKRTIENDFEPHVFEKHPILNQIKCELYNSGALYASMSGSGSTVYGVFSQNTDSKKLKKQFSLFGNIFFFYI